MAESPQSWWEPQIQAKLSQGDILKAICWGTSPPEGDSYLEKSSAGGTRVWRESDSFKTDNDGIGYFLARGRIVPAIVLTHDCTIENDGPRARVLVAPMFPWSNLDSNDPAYKQAVLDQRQRSLLPLTNVPSLNADYYGDLRAMTFIPRKIIGAGDAIRIASMSVTGVMRLQSQIADFFIRFKVAEEHLASSRKEEAQDVGQKDSSS
jgi:hypothetical protein